MNNTNNIRPVNPYLQNPFLRHRGQFGRLSMLYYPGRSMKRASHLFREEIRQTPGLLEALKRVGYQENKRVLSPRQVQVIEKFLGEVE